MKKKLQGEIVISNAWRSLVIYFAVSCFLDSEIFEPLNLIAEKVSFASIQQPYTSIELKSAALYEEEAETQTANDDQSQLARPVKTKTRSTFIPRDFPVRVKTNYENINPYPSWQQIVTFFLVEEQNLEFKIFVFLERHQEL